MLFVNGRMVSALLPVALLCLGLSACMGGGKSAAVSNGGASAERVTTGGGAAKAPAGEAAPVTDKRSESKPVTASASSKSGVAGEDVMPQLARQDYQLALGALKNGKYEVAERFLQPLVERFPELSGPLANLAIIYFHTGREQLAREAFKKVTEMGPNAAASNYLGILARRDGDFAAAEKYYRQAIVAESTYANAYLNLGILQDLYLGDLQAALASYKHYQMLTRDQDKTVEKWIVDLQRRM